MRMNLTIFAIALLLATSAPGLASAGSLLGNSDKDSLDDVVDNCRDDTNPTQLDTDLDGCGNMCDGDYDNNGKAGGTDFTRLKFCFGLAASATNGLGQKCAPVDANDDGKIGSVDFNQLRKYFGQKAGISLSPLRKPALCRAF